MTQRLKVLFLLPAFLLGAACGGGSTNDAGTDVVQNTDTGTVNDTGSTGDSATGDGSTAACASATFTAVLTGAQEVPPTTSTATGMGTFALNATCDTLTYMVTHTVTGATMAHIHEGAVGASGAVVFPFASATSPISGTTPITAAQVSTLLSGGYYVNVHSAANASGEIRGQITPVVH